MNNPVTELDAVNLMLETIGAAPVNRLEGVHNEDVIVARQILAQVSREVQSEEWYFNTEDGCTFVPDEEGYIRVPADITRINTTNRHSTSFWGPANVIVRGDKLYDKDNHTYKFDADITADITLCLPFDELPHEAKNYILIRACRKFDVISSGDTEREKWTAQDEMRARADLLAADTEQGKSVYGYRFGIDPLLELQFSHV